MSPKRSSGFTLVEVLIVIVIMAILAATIIPQFSDAGKDAKESNLKFNLHTLRSQIALYRAQHDGRVPNQDDDLAQLSSKTTVNGTIDATGVFGPYVSQIPENPFNASQTVAITAADPPGDADVTADDGWLYNTTTGEIWINWAGLVSE